MTLWMNFKMAISSVWSSKVRSFLTMLGIIIGVAAVIVLVSMVSASTKSMKTQLESMGTNLITVNIVNRGWGSGRSVSVEEIESVCEQNSAYISACSPVVSSRATVKYGGENMTSSLMGVNSNYTEIRNREAVSGRFFTDADIETRNSVCVIGQYVVNEVFGGRDAVGQQVKINGEMFTVIGVLDQKSSNATSGGDDDVVMMPYTKAQRLIRNSGITSFVVSAVSSDYTSVVTAVLENFLYKKFKNENYYTVTDNASTIESIDEALAPMAALAAGIAGISLIVAGIGIMNIMLVTVTERTREIGIRKSIGARTGTILMQFLIESAVISGIGGIFGIVLGVAGSAGLSTMLDLPVLTIFEQMGTIIGSFLFSVAMGIGFGLYPARRAAKLNPVDALRFE
ncbi:MAG: ABC transporter permease [Clostridia bacterium]|nr:ABC transporter permease [Clostridia bacterium]